jgi:hypothetical protein
MGASVFHLEGRKGCKGHLNAVRRGRRIEEREGKAVKSLVWTLECQKPLVALPKEGGKGEEGG